MDLLNELVFLHESEGLAFAAIEVQEVTEKDVRARVGVATLSGPPGGTAVKAATYHQLAVEELPEGGVQVKVFLDV